MNQRDPQLRASMLTHARLLGVRSADGWVTGRKLAIAARDDDGRGASDEAHAAALIDWLVERGLLVEKEPDPDSRGAADLGYRKFKRTDKAHRLWTGEIDPIPGVASRSAE
jgi:hypothetical protein